MSFIYTIDEAAAAAEKEKREKAQIEKDKALVEKIAAEIMKGIS